MLLMRLKTMGGREQQEDTFALMDSVLHSDCYLKGEVRKIRKHTKLSMANVR
jgi:hypothetical protein